MENFSSDSRNASPVAVDVGGDWVDFESRDLAERVVKVTAASIMLQQDG